jgi:hypothetical protein
MSEPEHALHDRERIERLAALLGVKPGATWADIEAELLGCRESLSRAARERAELVSTNTEIDAQRGVVQGWRDFAAEILGNEWRTHDDERLRTELKWRIERRTKAEEYQRRAEDALREIKVIADRIVDIPF